MTIDVWLLEAGFSDHPELTVLDGGGKQLVRLGATVGVLEHPHEGVVLFDTGYTPRFHDVTRRFPDRVFAIATPVQIPKASTAVEQLRERGIAPHDVRHVVLSHFHADHIGGVADFPRARFVFRDEAWSAVRDLRGVARVQAGYLPGLLPSDFGARVHAFGASDMTTTTDGLGRGYDLFRDGSVVLVGLPGHAPGHIGALVAGSDGRRSLFVADAVWLTRALRERRMPGRVTSMLIRQRGAYQQTLSDLARFTEHDPSVRVVPCHCSEALARGPLLTQRPAGPPRRTQPRNEIGDPSTTSPGLRDDPGSH
jgi:glyoxylase-like metal-dependent hydrolase (beta-lactamase superfamily II)